MASKPAKTNDAEVVPAREYAPAIVAIGDRIAGTGRYAASAVFLLRALQANTIEEATDIGEVISARDELLGERLRIIDVTFLDSDPELDAPVPWFAVIDCIREMTGERIKAECGAEHVLGVLIRACEMDWFPFDAELVSIGLGAGKHAINLRLAPQRVDTIEGSL